MWVTVGFGKYWQMQEKYVKFGMLFYGVQPLLILPTILWCTTPVNIPYYFMVYNLC